VSLPLAIYDVFADRPFRGNPAAVVRVAGRRQLSDSQLISVAAELMLPETALSHWDGSVLELRFATAARVVNRCGHATLAGIADHVLVHEANSRTSERLWTGSYRVGSAGAKWRASFAPAMRSRMSNCRGLDVEVTWPERPHRIGPLPAKKVYAAIGSKPSDSVPDLAPCIYDSGNRNALVSLATPALLRSVRISWPKLERLFNDYQLTDLHLYCPEQRPKPGASFRLRCRNVFPYGVKEEAATGSASIALAGFLAAQTSVVRHDVDATDFLFEQGVGPRRGRIVVSWRRDKSGFETYSLKGRVFPIVKGELVSLPK